MNTNSHFINGSWLAGNGEYFEKVNPSDNAVIWSGHAGSEQDVALAVSAARTAFPKWAATGLEERIALLQRFSENLAKEATQLSQTISKETGKPEWETKTEVQAMINKVKISIQSSCSK